MGQITDKQIEKLQELNADAMDLNIRMEQHLVEIVKANGGFIRTDNDKNASTLYGYVFDDMLESTIERKILGIAVFEDKHLGILLGENYDMFEDSETDEQILERDDWYLIFGGYLMTNATLVCICESITDYLCD